MVVAVVGGGAASEGHLIEIDQKHHNDTGSRSNQPTLPTYSVEPVFHPFFLLNCAQSTSL